MNLLKEQITDIVEDLEHKQSIMKDKELEDIPAEYIGEAVYSYVIDRLKGLIK